MNPTSTGGPELQLPTPVAPAHAPETAVGPAIPLPQGVPQQPTSTAPVPSVQPSLPPVPPVQSQAAATQAGVSNTTTISVPAVADDQDLIEKEWVAKAKNIVEKNRNDPYQQSQELTVFKNDYLSKRYNKTIKMDE